MDGNICRICWARVPLALRKEWNGARQACGTFHRGKRAIQADIQRWVRENPAPPRPTNEVPPWRRHTQETRKGSNR